MNPAVSVLLPVYNAQRYVAEAVESILAQSFSDFELIIVDDGSTDGSLRILRRFAARDPRVRLVSRENRGLVATLNEMIAMARGELLARMDADDISLPDRLALQVDYLRNHPDVVCVGGGQIWIDDGGFAFHEFQFPCGDAEIQELLLNGVTSLVHPSVMMRRGAVLDVGGYDPEMKEGEDFDLWLRLGERGRLANLEQVIIKYRIHDRSKTVLDEEPSRYGQLACERSRRRRGLRDQTVLDSSWKPMDFAARYDLLHMYGWRMFLGHDRRTALRYALHLVYLAPRRLDGWRLLACSLVKPVRRTA
jgi:glycosyltransferase involved in cell wall biosynthesis